MVFLHDGSPSQDVLHVGKRKAVGYVAFSETPEPRFIEPVELDALAAELASRGMETRCYRSTADEGHKKEIAALCQLLPLVLYDRKLRPSFWVHPWNLPTFYAFDRDTIESFLESNKEILQGFPATADAFVDLIESVQIDHRTPLGSLITTAFGNRFATLYDKGQAPHPYDRQFALAQAQRMPKP